VFAVVFVPNFALHSLLRHEPELRERPVALVEAAGANSAKAIILECTRNAEAGGVSPGFTAPQAQARCRELILRSRVPAAEQSATNILLQTAYAFSPNIENTAPGFCTIDLRGLNFGGCEVRETTSERSHFTSTAAHDNTAQPSFEFFAHTPCASLSFEQKRASLIRDWAGAIITALRGLGLESQVGLGCTPNIALLAARAAKTILLVEQVDEFFGTLPVAALDPTPQVSDVLKRWGIHTVGAFLALGKEAIAERLGADALELFQCANVQTIRPLNIVAPADTFEEQMDFETLIETIEPLLFVLRRFVEQLATRIALTYRVVGELRLRLTLESGLSYERAFKVPAPTTSVDTLFRMLHTHLENLRTDAPVQSLRLAAAPIRAEEQQFGLFESALRDPNHFHETLARLTALLGPGRVGTPVAEPTHRPDGFQMMTPAFANPSQTANGQHRNAKQETRNSLGLCLRRFRSPIHAEVEMNNGHPAFISTLVMSARIKCARGPWCISGTWWDQRRWARQEWDVETENGELYRLRNAEGDWLLEGVYD
jgi:protein ImuB